jgi:hypothetical protein
MLAEGYEKLSITLLLIGLYRHTFSLSESGKIALPVCRPQLIEIEHLMLMQSFNIRKQIISREKIENLLFPPVQVLNIAYSLDVGVN